MEVEIRSYRFTHTDRKIHVNVNSFSSGCPNEYNIPVPIS